MISFFNVSLEVIFIFEELIFPSLFLFFLILSCSSILSEIFVYVDISFKLSDSKSFLFNKVLFLISFSFSFVIIELLISLFVFSNSTSYVSLIAFLFSFVILLISLLCLM